MRFVSSLRSVSKRPAFVSAGRNVFRLAALSVLGASFVQLPIYAQSLAASTEATRSSQGTIDIEFADAPVSEILTSVASMSNANIIVAPGVSSDRIPTLKLHDVTVEQALQNIALAAGLSWRKEGNVYIVSKMTSPAPGNFGGSVLGAPSITAGVAGTPFAAPGLGGDNLAPMTGDLASLGIPDIASSKSFKQETTYKMITLRNIKPSLMAYWLDPARHPEPTEFRQSRELQENVNEINNPRSMQEDEKARDDERRARLGQTYGTPVNAPNGYMPFANPYANPYGALTPYTQFSNQFGGGGGGNNRGGGGGNNRGGGNNNGGGGNNNGGNGGGGGNVNPADGVIQLPNGVDNIIAIDAQNAILIQGSGDGIETIQTIIDFLDKPVQQVEIEAQFVELTEGASNALGLDFTRNNTSNRGFFADTGQSVLAGGGTALLGYVGRNFTANFNALKSKNLLKVVNSPRITTFNNMTAQLTSVQTVRIITLQTNVTNNDGGNTQTQTQVITPITTGVTLTVTPTINRDGTITMAVQPYVSTQNFQAGRIFPDISNQQISTMSNVKDGDTLAIGGLRVKSSSDFNREVPILGKIPIIGKILFSSKGRTYNERELVIFLTPRVVRRIEDPVPGT